MGTYINPGAGMFKEALDSEIYIDKSMLISYTNSVVGTRQKYVCVSRPRRFGKSMAAEMLTAYYDRTADSIELFKPLNISETSDFSDYLNKFDVIKLNMQEFLSRTHDIHKMIDRIEKVILHELVECYPDVKYFDKTDLIDSLNDAYHSTHQKFIIIIDEWDCIFREYKNDLTSQDDYLDFLRDVLKDREYAGLVYMTGILPIKKYGSHSALNMFSEFSMEDPGALAEYVGFTEDEVKKLCASYGMDFDDCKSWYNGYYFHECGSVYNPNSIVRSMLSRKFSDYWNKTETYEALKLYIDLNFDGLKDNILKLMAGSRQKVDTSGFQNDMTTFNSADDILTLLIHLGYLGFDDETNEVFIPNKEIMQEFVTATKVNKV